MRQIATIALLAILVVGLIGCGGSNGTASNGSGAASEEATAPAPQVTKLEAEEAFAVGLASVFFASFQSAFGSAPEGTSLSEDSTVLTLDEFDLAEFKTDYSTVSGTATNNGEGMDCDLQLEGGPVETLQFSIEDFESETVEATVIVNGSPMSLALSEDTLGS